MTRQLLLTSALLASSMLAAQLPPTATAPLIDHLVEVNPLWLEQAGAELDLSVERSFADENDRIATHLQMVIHKLKMLPAGGTDRDALLNELIAYASAGRFPQNDQLPTRNPIFIDQNGTACAVGHLMIASGDHALAERIHQEMNFKYIREMTWPEVADWASDHGFTGGELALIQPGYPPNTVWDPPGGGMDSSVTAMVLTSQNDVIMAGRFLNAGGSPMMRVARWDGNQYTALGAGLDGVALDLIDHNGAIYAGGRFQNGQYDLAVWDGSAWTYTNMMPGLGPVVRAFIEINGVLYAAGEADGFAGTLYLVMRLDNGNWMMHGGQFNDVIHALGRYNGQPVAGGEFTQVTSATDPLVERVAIWDGTEWIQLADGLNAPVHALLEVNGSLYAAGAVDTTSNPIPFGMASMSFGNTTWQMELPGHESYIFPVNGEAVINSLSNYGGMIYLGGSFQIYPGLGTIGQHFGQFVIGSQYADAIAWFDAPVSDVLVRNGFIFAAGDFSDVNGQSNPYVATSQIISSVSDIEAPITSLSLHPNPAVDRLVVTLIGSAPDQAQLEVIDAAGRTLLQRSINLGINEITVADLPNGSYQVMATVNGAMTIEPLVIQR